MLLFNVDTVCGWLLLLGDKMKVQGRLRIGKYGIEFSSKQALRLDASFEKVE